MSSDKYWLCLKQQTSVVSYWRIFSLLIPKSISTPALQTLSCCPVILGGFACEATDQKQTCGRKLIKRLRATRRHWWKQKLRGGSGPVMSVNYPGSAIQFNWQTGRWAATANEQLGRGRTSRGFPARGEGGTGEGWGPGSPLNPVSIPYAILIIVRQSAVIHSWFIV